jgi:uncharacterized protein
VLQAGSLAGCSAVSALTPISPWLPLALQSRLVPNLALLAAASVCVVSWLHSSAMHPLIETHSASLVAMARKRGVMAVRVFGSMSRGDGTDSSDVDLLVTLAPRTSALALGGLVLDAQELLGRRVDVVTEASLHPALRERVLAGAVPL